METQQLQGLWPTLLGSIGALSHYFLVIFLLLAKIAKIMGKKKRHLWVSQGILLLAICDCFGSYLSPVKPYMFLLLYHFFSFWDWKFIYTNMSMDNLMLSILMN